MKRRTYCGVVGIAALSGCTALSGGSSVDDVGKSYETEAGVELTVRRVETQDGGEVTLGNGSPITSASSAITFVIPELVATNTTESALALPPATNFFINSGGQLQEPYQKQYTEVIDNLESTISQPVSGDLFPPVSEIGPDEEASGWLVFTVPEAGSTVSLELRLEDEVITTWSLNV